MFSCPDFPKRPGKLVGWSAKRSKLAHSLAVAVAVVGKFEQQLTIMTAMGQVIEFTREKVAVGSGHDGSIDAVAKFLRRKKSLKK